MPLKTPQDWYIDSLTEILRNKSLYIGNFGKDDAYKYVIKSFTDKYSNSFAWDKTLSWPFKKRPVSDIFDMYWGSFKSSTVNIILHTIITSEEAYNKLKKFKCGGKLNKTFHLEHLTPMSYSREKLLSLPSGYSRSDVENCFKYAVVALITKKESEKLDKKGSNRLSKKDIEDLEGLMKKYSIINKSELTEAKNIFKRKLSLLKNGNGLIRLIHLYNEGVSFVYSNGTKITSIEDLVDLLIKNKFTINQY